MDVAPPPYLNQRRSPWRTLVLATALVGLAAVAAAAPQAVVHTVVIDGMQFSPAALEVNVGDTVIWKNKDLYPHTATSQRSGFDSGTVSPGGSWQFTATKRGTYPYFCALHPPMKGSLVVTEKSVTWATETF